MTNRDTIGVAALVVVAVTVACWGDPQAAFQEVQANLNVGSPAFAEGGEIPVEFTCDGADRSPALSWSGANSSGGLCRHRG